MSEWTTDTLKEYLLAEVKSTKELATMALANSDKAVAKAETATEKRFEGVNEFRQTLADQQRTLMPRQEAELQLQVLEKNMSCWSLGSQRWRLYAGDLPGAGAGDCGGRRHCYGAWCTAWPAGKAINWVHA